MRKAQRCWGMLLGVMVKEGATVQVRVILYKAVL